MACPRQVWAGCGQLVEFVHSSLAVHGLSMPAVRYVTVPGVLQLIRPSPLRVHVFLCPHGFPVHLDAVRAGDQTVHDRVGDGGVADHLVPVLDLQ